MHHHVSLFNPITHNNPQTCINFNTLLQIFTHHNHPHNKSCNYSFLLSNIPIFLLTLIFNFMALETWLMKVKKTISNSLDAVRSAATPPNSNSKLLMVIKKSNKVGVLAFEIAGLMSKLLHLWQSLSDKNIVRLRSGSISLEGVRKIVSNDETFLLGLACSEMVENLRLVAKSLCRISKKCEDSNLRSFDRLFHEFASTGRDPNNWVSCFKEMEARKKKMDQYVTVTATLRRELDELSALENALQKSVKSNSSKENQEVSIKEQKISDLQQRLHWHRQQIKCLKERSLWNRSFDTVTFLLARSIFTTLARIKLGFGIGHGCPTSLPRSLSASATVHPTENHDTCNFVSGPLVKTSSKGFGHDFLELNSKILKPPSSTLGASALALHYANLIIVMEKMIKSPHLVGVDARDDLYSMLPESIRSSLRARLKGVGFSATDPVLAGEWREALGNILGWLSPLAHNMIKWQSERSFEHQNLVPATNVLLLQTLYFASQEKTEAAITELLVGLNYVWRFEREMNAKALFECSNFKGVLDLRNSS